MTTETEQITYGLMPQKDYDTMTKILEAVCIKFSSGIIKTFELGIHKGNGSRGIHKFFEQRKRIHFHVGVDNGHDVPVIAPYDGCHVIEGNTYEVYNQLEDDSFNFGLVDANHSYPMTVIDVWCYAKKIKKNGFLALHDTGAHIEPYTDYQNIGDRADKDMFISCRKAAEDLGLLNDRSYVNGCTFEKVYDIADNGSHTGGILCLKRIM